MSPSRFVRETKHKCLRQLCDRPNPWHPSRSTLPKLIRDHISSWLDENLEHLIRSAAKRLGIPRPSQLKIVRYTCLTKMRSADHFFIHNKVTEQPCVENFPCFANVLKTTFELLYAQLYTLLRRKNPKDKIYISASIHIFMVSLPRDFKLHSTPRSSDIAKEDKRNARLFRFETKELKKEILVVNPYVTFEMAKVKSQMSLSYADQYWSIIRFASECDRDPVKAGQIIMRQILRVNDKGKLKREWLMGLMTIIGQSRDEFAGLADKGNDAIEYIKNIREQLPLRLDQTTPDLIALLSLSWALASRIKVIDQDCTTENGVPNCTQVRNEGCHRFWGSRFLFADKRGRHGHCFEGVALDTVTGRVWNADMNYEHCLCPRTGWSCSLKPVTKERWDKYVAVNGFSLTKFSEKNRFRPSGGIHIKCGSGFQLFKPVDSILLSPL